MNNYPLLSDLKIFQLVVYANSFSKVADEIGMSPAFITKRIRILEEILNCTLLLRSTRSMQLTDQGKILLQWSEQVLTDMDHVVSSMINDERFPSGNLNITSSLGFGHACVAPLLSEFVKEQPYLTIRFDTVDQLPDMVEQRIDLDIRIGNNIAHNLITKKIFPNRRVLCASPEYLQRKGTPKFLNDLHNHNCLVIKERDHPFGIWDLNSKTKEVVSIKVRGNLSSNNGDIVRLWALQDHGIMLRSIWDIGKELIEGSLVQILPEYWQDADIWAVYPIRLNKSRKLQACVNFLQENLPKKLNKLKIFYT